MPMEGASNVKATQRTLGLLELPLEVFRLILEEVSAFDATCGIIADSRHIYSNFDQNAFSQLRLASRLCRNECDIVSSRDICFSDGVHAKHMERILDLVSDNKDTIAPYVQSLIIGSFAQVGLYHYHLFRRIRLLLPLVKNLTLLVYVPLNYPATRN